MTALPPLESSEGSSWNELSLRLAARLTGEGHQALPFNVCGYRFTRPSTFKKARSFGVTLGVVAQGAKVLRAGGSELEARPGRLMLITREAEHELAVTQASADRPFLGLGLCFGPEQVARALLTVCAPGGCEETEETADAFITPSTPRLLSAIVRLLDALDDPLERKVLAPLCADEILFHLLRSDAAAGVRGGVSRAADGRRILEAMQFIKGHLGEPLTVDRVAREVAMSPSHFAHRFTAIARMSPMRYLREARLEQAQTLLLGERARPAEVAAQIGFESPSHFNRSSSAGTGLPPRPGRGPGPVS